MYIDSIMLIMTLPDVLLRAIKLRGVCMAWLSFSAARRYIASLCLLLLVVVFSLGDTVVWLIVSHSGVLFQMPGSSHHASHNMSALPTVKGTKCSMKGCWATFAPDGLLLV